jgi:hypothetical protein
MRDIDLICERLGQLFPGIQIHQLVTTHPGDDNGLWYVHYANRDETLQMESPTGNCPFLIEFDTSATTSDRFVAESTDQALDFLSRQITRWGANRE